MSLRRSISRPSTYESVCKRDCFRLERLQRCRGAISGLIVSSQRSSRNTLAMKPFERAALKRARREAGFTQAELAALVGCGQQTVSKHESGAATPAHFKTLRAYEEVLGVPACELFPDVFGAEE
nr:MAG TPA: Helix-turn-helix XRE-family like protein [Bacteriophage sp.]DAM51297.1 MAG TPA: Helix-turn-helix XRE-family like protein [Caudoviricetes sp.]